jgi:hypothetical protein
VEENYQSVACVTRLAAERRVRRCLTGLHITDNKSASLPYSGFVGISQQIKHLIRNGI